MAFAEDVVAQGLTVVLPHPFGDVPSCRSQADHEAVALAWARLREIEVGVRVRIGLLLVVLLLLAPGCSGSTPPGSPDASPPAGSAPATAAGSASPTVGTGAPPAGGAAPATPSAAGGAGPSPAVTKLLVLVVENHSLEQMRRQMPYTFRLARKYGYAARYFAIRHPSLPNYLAITSGDTHGVADDKGPAAHPLNGPSVFGQALQQGRTAAVYADGMRGACATSDGGNRYAVRHNPWAYHVSERKECKAHDQPLSALAPAVQQGRLPDAGMVVPNLCHDAHDCDLSVADDWLRGQLEQVLAGPDWRSGHLAVVVTADEDDRSAGNRVLTVVVHPSQSGHVVTDRLDHYSLSGLYSDVVGAPRLGHAASAPSMAKAFGLPLQ